MAHPYTWIEIDSLALSQNIRTVRDYIGEGMRLIAVVKANAYGHGFGLASEAFWRAGIDAFAVTTVDDALSLVEKYPKTPTILLTPCNPIDLGKLLERNVRVAVGTESYLELVHSTALRYDTRAYVHLEVETGMHRFGFSPEKALAISDNCRQGPVTIEALFTHPYQAASDEVLSQQIDRMQQLLFGLQQADIPLPWVHVATSEAIGYSILPSEDVLFDGVRCGRLLYGMSLPNLSTRSPLTWKTKVTSLYSLKHGETVGYNATYTADRDKMIAVLPVGYFDGLDRKLGNTGCVLIQGKRCPIVGHVCMNNMMVDVSPVMRPQVGDDVVLLGAQGDETITAAEYAHWIGTIDYEVLARLPLHIPRVKVK